MNQRPKFLQLYKIHFPVAAVVSLLHRVSGVLLSLTIPLLVYLFGLSIQDESGYRTALSWLTSPLGKAITLLLLWAIAHHFFAGIRFLLLDVDIGISKSSSARSAWLVHGGAALITLLALGFML